MSSHAHSTNVSRFSSRMLLGLGVLSILLYFTVLDSSLIERDRMLTVYNQQVSMEGPISRIWLQTTPYTDEATAYRPVLASLLRAQWKMRGESSSSFHFFNLILFVALVGVFYRLAGLLGLRPWAVVVASLLLTLHPMASQSLHTISGQGALLAVLAMMLAATLVLQMRAGRLAPIWGLPALFVATFVAGGSHELGLLQPLFLAGLLMLPPMDEVYVSEFRKKSRKQKESEEPVAGEDAPLMRWQWVSIPVVAAFLLLIGMRVIALGGLLPQDLNRPLELSALQVTSVLKPLALIGAYVFKLLCPFQPSLFYHPAYGGFPLPPMMAVLLALLPVAVLGIGLKKNPLVALGAGWMLLPMVAVSQLIPHSVFFSEEFLLFSLPGFALVVGCLMGGIMGSAVKIPPASMQGKLAFVLLFVYLLAGGVVTVRRGLEWSDPFRLMTAESGRHPEDPYPYIAMIREGLAKGETSGIDGWLEAAHPLAQGNAAHQLTLLESTYLIDQQRFDDFDGLVKAQVENQSPDPDTLLKLGSFASAAERFEMSELIWNALLAQDPKSFRALTELTSFESNRGNHAKAIELGNRMVAAAQGEAQKTEAMAVYGRVLFSAGRHAEAFQQMGTVLDRDKSQYLAYMTMAEILWSQKQYTEAVAAVNACITNCRLETYADVARIYTGVLVAQDKLPAAIQWLNDRVRQAPRDVKLRIFAGRFLEFHKMYQEAWDTLYPVREINSPLRADVLLAMGLVQANGMKNYDLAIQLATMARQIKPNNTAATDLIRQSAKLRTQKKLDSLDEGQ